MIKKEKIEVDENKLIEKIKDLPNRYKFLFETVDKIKNDLKKYKVIYPEKKGINVVIRFGSDEEKNKLIKYCEENNYEWILCPKYIKVNVPAISIEVKRLS